jgi:hypothetical protein
LWTLEQLRKFCGRYPMRGALMDPSRTAQIADEKGRMEWKGRGNED